MTNVPRLGPAWQPPGLGRHAAEQAAEQAVPRPPATEVIAVCSGKGGVGKSTVALNVAVALAGGGARVGLLDADVHAPDIPLMLGLARKATAKHWTLARPGGLSRTPLEPVERHGLKLMSTGFIVGEDQPVTWTADLVGALINQLLWSTVWGELDYLVLDLPPGTGDITQAIIRLVPTARAVLVVTPQDAAHLDTRRVISALQTAQVSILGGIENMSGLTCPCCATRIELFPPVAAHRSIWAAGVTRLGAVPMDPAGQEGDAEPVVLTHPASPRAVALSEAAEAIREAIGKPTTPG